MAILMIYVTCADEAEAMRIADALLDKRLIACANIPAPHRAVYRWEGKTASEPEQGMILKTKPERFDKVKETIVAMHSYDCPCIVAWDADKGHAPFMDWVAEETG